LDIGKEASETGMTESRQPNFPERCTRERKSGLLFASLLWITIIFDYHTIALY